MLVIFADESLWMPLIYPVRCVHFPVVPYHRDSMSPRACSEFRLRPSCHRETPLPDPWRPRIRSLPETKWERRVLPRNGRNSTKLDESSLVVVSFESFEVWVDESRDELRVEIVFLDVISKLQGAVPKLKEHFLRCISHQAHDSQHCICPWMLFQQLHFVLVAFILMGRSDLDDVINC